ncbi:unnamed protein product [Penicillium camemberti]|uniref:Str. FM013 n=1 Tax=Penicillium camemberti (strain FM 013) TaxID=1429867 RepID=A0A0G4PHN6_PENC3|nr:unnamed protein product [Penicillium camemberti]
MSEPRKTSRSRNGAAPSHWRDVRAAYRADDSMAKLAIVSNGLRLSGCVSRPPSLCGGMQLMLLGYLIVGLG